GGAFGGGGFGGGGHGGRPGVGRLGHHVGLPRRRRGEQLPREDREHGDDDDGGHGQRDLARRGAVGEPRAALGVRRARRRRPHGPNAVASASGAGWGVGGAGAVIAGMSTEATSSDTTTATSIHANDVSPRSTAGCTRTRASHHASPATTPSRTTRGTRSA